MKRVFEMEFGKPPEELFAEFNYKPIAAASLAQVFRAKTKSGQDVAVKVQYIDLIKRFSGDFFTILSIQNIIQLIHKDYSFGWILRDVRKNLEQVRLSYNEYCFPRFGIHFFICIVARNLILFMKARMRNDVLMI